MIAHCPPLRAGVPLKVVSTRLGHADPAVTMQVYAHALEGDDSTAAETTATAIFSVKAEPRSGIGRNHRMRRARADH